MTASSIQGRIPCHLLLEGDSPHIRQIVTGFYELAAAGVVDLVVSGRAGVSDEWLHPLTLRAIIAGRRVIYDANDGWYVAPELQPYLPSADFYFKRSIDPHRLEGVPASVPVLPLGLNYLVTSRLNHWHKGTRPVNPRRLLRTAVRRASVLGTRIGIRDVRDMVIGDFEVPPTVPSAPRILFMCRAWESESHDSAYSRSQCETVNETRAACIRTGRTEFGKRFHGGFIIDEFARREYGDCLLPHGTSSARRAYLTRVHESAICVATTGLHGSIGWKMAEYVAASRAIVSEPLRYPVPGGFAAGRNFLEFTSLDDFVISVDRLLSDVSLRTTMMRANWDYYWLWVRPDAQVLRTIERVLGSVSSDRWSHPLTESLRPPTMTT